MRRVTLCLQSRLAALAVLLLLSGCATQPRVFDHALSFDVSYDGQNAEILDYRYGASRLPVRAPAEAVAQGKPLYQANVSGPMQRGDSLYVKWRNRSTGAVYEDTADLRQRLPADMTGQRIHFMVNGAQLYVYLISPEPRRRDGPADGPRLYRDRQSTLIYPDKAKQQY